MYVNAEQRRWADICLLSDQEQVVCAHWVSPWEPCFDGSLSNARPKRAARVSVVLFQPRNAINIIAVDKIITLYTTSGSNTNPTSSASNTFLSGSVYAACANKRTEELSLPKGRRRQLTRYWFRICCWDGLYHKYI